MTIDTPTLNRQKMALKQLEVITDELSSLYKDDPFYASVIDSLCIFSRSLDDITHELSRFNRNR